MICLYCGDGVGWVEDCPLCDRPWSVINSKKASFVYMDLSIEIRKEAYELAIPLADIDVQRIAAERYLELVEKGFVE